MLLFIKLWIIISSLFHQLLLIVSMLSFTTPPVTPAQSQCQTLYSYRSTDFNYPQLCNKSAQLPTGSEHHVVYYFSWSCELAGIFLLVLPILMHVAGMKVSRWLDAQLWQWRCLSAPGSWFSFMSLHSLVHDSANVFYEGPGSAYFRVCGPYSLCHMSVLPL